MPAPSSDEREYHATVREERDAAFLSDPILSAKSSAETVAAAILELAKEAAGLAFERERAEERGRDAAAISSRRIDALGKLASLVRDAHRLGIYGNDPSPKKVALLLECWIESVGEIARDVLPEATATLLMSRYQAAISETDIVALTQG